MWLIGVFGPPLITVLLLAALDVVADKRLLAAMGFGVAGWPARSWSGCTCWLSRGHYATSTSFADAIPALAIPDALDWKRPRLWELTQPAARRFQGQTSDLVEARIGA